MGSEDEIGNSVVVCLFAKVVETVETNFVFLYVVVLSSALLHFLKKVVGEIKLYSK